MNIKVNGDFVCCIILSSHGLSYTEKTVDFSEISTNAYYAQRVLLDNVFFLSISYHSCLTENS